MKTLILALLFLHIAGCAKLFPDPCAPSTQEELDALASSDCGFVSVDTPNHPWLDNSISIVDFKPLIEVGDLPALVERITVTRSNVPIAYTASAQYIYLEDSFVGMVASSSVDTTVRCTAGKTCRYLLAIRGKLSLNFDESADVFLQGSFSGVDELTLTGKFDVWSLDDYTIDMVKRLPPPRKTYQLYDGYSDLRDEQLTQNQIDVVRYVATLAQPRPAVEVYRAYFEDTGYRVIDVDAYVAENPE
jgi:hypothetical protein